MQRPRHKLHPSPSLGCTGLLIKSPCGSDGSASASLMCHQRSPEWDPWMELTQPWNLLTMATSALRERLPAARKEPLTDLGLREWLPAARKEPLTDLGADPTLLAHHIPSPGKLSLDLEVAGPAALGSPGRDGHEHPLARGPELPCLPPALPSSPVPLFIPGASLGLTASLHPQESIS